MNIQELLVREKEKYDKLYTTLNALQNLKANIIRLDDNLVWCDKVDNIYGIFDILDSIVDLDYTLSYYYTDGDILRIVYSVKLNNGNTAELNLKCGDITGSIAILTENNCKYITETVTIPAAEAKTETHAKLVCQME